MNTFISSLHKIYSFGILILSSLQSPFLLAVRLYWGWQFAETGWGKLMNLEKITGYFTSLNIPFPQLNAIMAGSTECFGGILLAIGLASRPAALALTFTMLVAYLTADREALFSIFSEPGTFYNADPYTFLFAAVLVVIFGPGKVSLDALIAKLVFKKDLSKTPSTSI